MFSKVMLGSSAATSAVPVKIDSNRRGFERLNTRFRYGRQRIPDGRIGVEKEDGNETFRFIVTTKTGVE